MSVKKRLPPGTFFLIIIVSFFYMPPGTSPTHAAVNLRENDVVRAVRQISPAVVNISTQYEVRRRVNPFSAHGRDDFFKNFFDPGVEKRQKLTSLGSGVIIDGKRGFILTNAHVIARGGKITVVLKDGRRLEAEIVGADSESDLAVLRIAPDELLPDVKMGNSDDLMIGETVIAIGNPYGFSNTVTTGVVSAVNRSVRIDKHIFRNFIQTDASINPGNSGGPLLNILGELIGINSAIYKNAEGIGFAIPINRAKKIVADLIDYGEVVPGWIGLIVGNISPNLADYLNIKKGNGVVVKSVAPSSPAGKINITPGDVILELDKTLIHSVYDYRSVLRGASKGRTMPIKILRGKKNLSGKVVAGIFPEDLAPSLGHRLLGIKVVGIDKKNNFNNIYASSGVIISQIDSGSPLAGIGVRPGDVIRKIDNQICNDTDAFYRAVVKKRWKESVVILLQRGEHGYYITVKLAE
ncbi:MAG: PDZ domain-containing protein [Deltaproteobacteria bacterium]|nr:PDZ domain-containing protein [Deltaproteobacteria bacterium]